MQSCSQPNRAEDDLTVCELATQVLGEVAAHLRQNMISLETDLHDCHIAVEPTALRPIIRSMLGCVVNSIAIGGRLSLISIECEQHWELEITSPVPPIDRTNTKADSNGAPASGVLQLVPSLTTPSLETVRRRVNQIGGHLETWQSPQGGMTLVLMMPIEHRRTHPTTDVNASTLTRQ